MRNCLELRVPQSNYVKCERTILRVLRRNLSTLETFILHVIGIIKIVLFVVIALNQVELKAQDYIFVNNYVDSCEDEQHWVGRTIITRMIKVPSENKVHCSIVESIVSKESVLTKCCHLPDIKKSHMLTIFLVTYELRYSLQQVIAPNIYRVNDNSDNITQTSKSVNNSSQYKSLESVQSFLQYKFLYNNRNTLNDVNKRVVYTTLLQRRRYFLSFQRRRMVRLSGLDEKSLC
uniref:Uncharacterized protein n=1 Tax=Glossina palpalis gambiensis TaxID=67801 RepID=A0A1B0ATZ8_9MUSC